MRLSSLLHATAVVRARGGAQSAASRVTFLKTMTNTIKRTATAQVFDVAKAQADLAALPPPPMEEGDKLIDLALDQYEKAILPLLEAGETVLARFDGKIYEDMCEPCCVNERTWYPGCMLIALCGVTPKFSKTAVVVTDKTVYCLQDNSNEPHGMCCEEGGFCFNIFKQRNYAIFWAPLSALTGAEIETVLVGTETFCTRCCYKTFIGDNCCPMLQSTATAKVLLESFIDCVTVTAQNKDFHRPLRDEPNLARFRQSVSVLQHEMTKDHTGARKSSVGAAASGFFSSFASPPSANTAGETKEGAPADVQVAVAMGPSGYLCGPEGEAMKRGD